MTDAAALRPGSDGGSAPGTQPHHGTVVAFRRGPRWHGVLLVGPSGSGKSALALELMAFGARLVADDRVVLKRSGAQLVARPPEPLEGLIEARGLGLLRADWLAKAAVSLVVDLGQSEPMRLPPARRIDLMGVRLPHIYRPEIGSGLAAALRQAILGGMVAVTA